jgi:hypothetical protein
MQARIHWLLTLSLLACAACTPTAQSPTASDSTAGNASASAPAASSAPAAEPTAASDSGFVLTMDKVDAYYATIAKMSTMIRDEGASDDVTAMNSDESVDQYIARIQADPKAAAMITSAGMSVSDYAHTNEALLAGMMTAGALDSGALKTIPAGINPQYVEFARTHKAELAAKLAALQKQFGGG